MTWDATKAIKRCQGCIHYYALSITGDANAEPVHLCQLPPDCRPVNVIDKDEHDCRDSSDRGEYLGTFCGVMRRPDAVCGPTGAMWSKRPAYLDVVPVLDAMAREKFVTRFPLGDMARDVVLRKGDIAACRYGLLTRQVAERYGQTIAKTRRHLIQALANQWILADGRGGTGGIRWWPAGLAAKLRGEMV